MRILCVAIAALLFSAPLACKTTDPLVVRALCEKIAKAFSDSATEIADAVVEDEGQEVIDLLKENAELRHTWEEIGCELIFPE